MSFVKLSTTTDSLMVQVALHRVKLEVNLSELCPEIAQYFTNPLWASDHFVLRCIIIVNQADGCNHLKNILDSLEHDVIIFAIFRAFLTREPGLQGYYPSKTMSLSTSRFVLYVINFEIAYERQIILISNHIKYLKESVISKVITQQIIELSKSYFYLMRWFSLLLMKLSINQLQIFHYCNRTTLITNSIKSKSTLTNCMPLCLPRHQCLRIGWLIES